MLLPTNSQGSGFLLNTQHCFQVKGEREEPVQLQCLEKCKYTIFPTVLSKILYRESGLIMPDVSRQVGREIGKGRVGNVLALTAP